MNITFIQPYYQNIWEALGIGYIGSFLEKNYSEEPLRLNFFQGYFDSDNQIIEGSKNADIVGFSTTSPSFKHGVYLATEIRKINKKCRIVFGGWHPTALKEKINEPIIDQLVVGEGEHGFLSVIKGNTKKIINSFPATFEELPWPNRSLIKNNRTIDLCEKMNGLRIASFQAHRVCPLNCAFCSEVSMTGKFNAITNPIRERNITDLLLEIEYVKNSYKINYFKFVDATFDTRASYVIEFCKNKINSPVKDLKWECLIHAAFATEEMFYWLKQSGCEQINIGCESGSNKILKDIGKGLTTKIIIRVFDWAKKYNIKRRAFFILGMPNETEEDILLTEVLIMQIKPDVVGFTVLCPYPGSRLYDHTSMKDIDWSTTDEYANDFWKTSYFSNSELISKQAYLTNKFSTMLCERQK